MRTFSVSAARFMFIAWANPTARAEDCDGKTHDRDFTVTNGGEETIRFIHLSDADGEAEIPGKDWRATWPMNNRLTNWPMNDRPMKRW